MTARLRALQSSEWAIDDIYAQSSEIECLRAGLLCSPAVRDGRGVVRAAMNVTVHAAETSVETLTEKYLPLFLAAAAASTDWAAWQSRPIEPAPRVASREVG